MHRGCILLFSIPIFAVNILSAFLAVSGEFPHTLSMIFRVDDRIILRTSCVILRLFVTVTADVGEITPGAAVDDVSGTATLDVGFVFSVFAGQIIWGSEGFSGGFVA